MQQVVQIVQVLLPERQVESILRLQICQHGSRYRFFAIKWSARGREQQHVDKSDHNQQGRNNRQQAAQGIGQHGVGDRGLSAINCQRGSALNAKYRAFNA